MGDTSVGEEGGREEELTDLVLTCREDINDPNIDIYLRTLQEQLEKLVSDDHRSASVTVTKVEPWNSIRVTLNITRDAALHLRRLAESADPALTGLGILSVQMDGDRVVLLTGGGAAGGEPTEIVFNTSADARRDTSNDARSAMSNVQSEGAVCAVQSVISSRRGMLGPHALAMTSHEALISSSSCRAAAVGSPMMAASGMMGGMGAPGMGAHRMGAQGMQGAHPGGAMGPHPAFMPLPSNAAFDQQSPGGLCTSAGGYPQFGHYLNGQMRGPSPRMMNPSYSGFGSPTKSGAWGEEFRHLGDGYRGMGPGPGSGGGPYWPQEFAEAEYRRRSEASVAEHGFASSQADAWRMQQRSFQQQGNGWPPQQQGMTFDAGGMFDGLNPFGLPDASGFNAPTEATTPKKRKRIRKPKAAAAAVDAVTAEGASGSLSNGACVPPASSADVEGSQRDGSHGPTTSQTPPLLPGRMRTPAPREHIVNPVTGLLEPDWERADEERQSPASCGPSPHGETVASRLLLGGPPRFPPAPGPSHLASLSSQVLQVSTAGGLSGLQAAASLTSPPATAPPRKTRVSKKKAAALAAAAASSGDSQPADVSGGESRPGYPPLLSDALPLGVATRPEPPAGVVPPSVGLGSSKRAVEHALSLLFDDEEDEQAMKHDFDLLLKPAASRPGQRGVGTGGAKSGIPAKRVRKPKSQIQAGAWRPDGLEPTVNFAKNFAGFGDLAPKLSVSVPEEMDFLRCGSVVGAEEMKSSEMFPPTAAPGEMFDLPLNRCHDDARGEKGELLDYDRLLEDWGEADMQELLGGGYEGGNQRGVYVGASLRGAGGLGPGLGAFAGPVGSFQGHGETDCLTNVIDDRLVAAFGAVDYSAPLGGMPTDLESIRSSDLLVFNGLVPEFDVPNPVLSQSAGRFRSTSAKQRVRRTKTGASAAVSLSQNHDPRLGFLAAPLYPSVSGEAAQAGLLGLGNAGGFAPPVYPPTFPLVAPNTSMSPSVVVPSNHPLQPAELVRSPLESTELSRSVPTAGGDKSSPPRGGDTVVYPWGEEPDGSGTDSGVASNTSLSVGSDLSEPERVPLDQSAATAEQSSSKDLNAGGKIGGPEAIRNTGQPTSFTADYRSGDPGRASLLSAGTNNALTFALTNDKPAKQRTTKRKTDDLNVGLPNGSIGEPPAKTAVAKRPRMPKATTNVDARQRFIQLPRDATPPGGMVKDSVELMQLAGSPGQADARLVLPSSPRAQASPRPLPQRRSASPCAAPGPPHGTLSAHRPAIVSPSLPRQLSESVQRAMLGGGGGLREEEITPPISATHQGSEVARKVDEKPATIERGVSDEQRFGADGKCDGKPGAVLEAGSDAKPLVSVDAKSDPWSGAKFAPRVGAKLEPIALCKESSSARSSFPLTGPVSDGTLKFGPDATLAHPGPYEKPLKLARGDIPSVSALPDLSRIPSDDQIRLDRKSPSRSDVRGADASVGAALVPRTVIRITKTRRGGGAGGECRSRSKDQWCVQPVVRPAGTRGDGVVRPAGARGDGITVAPRRMGKDGTGARMDKVALGGSVEAKGRLKPLSDYESSIGVKGGVTESEGAGGVVGVGTPPGTNGTGSDANEPTLSAAVDGRMTPAEAATNNSNVAVACASRAESSSLPSRSALVSRAIGTSLASEVNGMPLSLSHPQRPGASAITKRSAALIAPSVLDVVRKSSKVMSLRGVERHGAGAHSAPENSVARNRRAVATAVSALESADGLAVQREKRVTEGIAASRISVAARQLRRLRTEVPSGERTEVRTNRSSTQTLPTVPSAAAVMLRKPIALGGVTTPTVGRQSPLRSRDSSRSRRVAVEYTDDAGVDLATRESGDEGCTVATGNDGSGARDAPLVLCPPGVTVRVSTDSLTTSRTKEVVVDDRTKDIRERTNDTVTKDASDERARDVVTSTDILDRVKDEQTKGADDARAEKIRNGVDASLKLMGDSDDCRSDGDRGVEASDVDRVVSEDKSDAATTTVSCGLESGAGTGGTDSVV